MDPNTRKKVLRMIPHGLQIVTCRDGEKLHGYTSSWMTQVSFEPPLLALGVRRDSLARSMIEREKVLVVHFPDREQVGLVKGFFKAPDLEDGRLGGSAYRIGEHTGCPVLEDVLAHAECRLVHEWEGGDHVVMIVEVLAVEVHREGEPLHMLHTPWQYGG